MKPLMVFILTVIFAAGFSTIAFSKTCIEVVFDEQGNPHPKEIPCPEETPVPEPTPEPTPTPEASKAGTVECYKIVIDKKGDPQKRMINCPKPTQKKRR